MSTIELDVRNMSCGSCVKHVTQALQAVAGVTGVQVDLDRGRVQVQTSAAADAKPALTPALVAALDSAGYPAAPVAAISTAAASAPAVPVDSAASGCAGASKAPGHRGSKGCCCGH